METAYGFCGRSGASSVVGTVSGGPYSSPEPTDDDDRLGRLVAHRLEHVRGHRDVVGERAERVRPRLPDVGARGEVVDDVGPRVRDERARDGGVAQVGLRRRRGGDDVVARGLAGRDEVAAGEARSAR